MRQKRMSNRAKSVAVAIGSLALIGVIIWLDVSTGVWNELVILSGLAAGLVTFLLTVLVLDKVIARTTERKWAPVNRFALTDFLHAIADEEHSEISRGHIVPRSLPHVDANADREAVLDALHALRHQVVDERSRLSDALSRWAEFLASSGDNEQILRHVAAIALQLDSVRDAAVEAETTFDGEKFAALKNEISSCNDSMLALEEELRSRITHEDQLARAESSASGAPLPARR